jgi:prolipoprotein diacylglyceryltransferase
LIAVGRRFSRQIEAGDAFLSCLIWHLANRILVESMRFDAWIVGDSGLATAQLISLALIAVAVVILILRHRPRRRAIPYA